MVGVWVGVGVCVPVLVGVVVGVPVLVGVGVLVKFGTPQTTILSINTVSVPLLTKDILELLEGAVTNNFPYF